MTDLIDAADLHPEPFVLHEVEQELKGWLIKPIGRIYAPDVIENRAHGERTDAFLLAQQILGIDMEVHGPAELSNVLHHAVEDIELNVSLRPVEDIEADSPDASIVEPL